MQNSKIDSDASSRLLSIETRIDDALLRLSRLEVVERRLEEAISYFAVRSNLLVASQSVYLGDDTAVTFLKNNLRILVDTRSMDVGIHLLTLGEWEPDYMALFNRLLRPGNTVLDIGANHGVYALHAALAVGPEGRVHAFEPNPRLARLVDLSMKINGFGGYATLHPVGVSDRTGTARLIFSESFSGGGAVASNEPNSAPRGTECNLIALDTVFADPGFKVDVIKMDVEGHEGLALRGMRNLLERSQHVKIMMEFGPEMMVRAGVSGQETISMLKSLGFYIWSINAQGGLDSVSHEVLAAEARGIQNIILSRNFPIVFGV